MANQVGIYNRALQKLGAKFLSSTSDATVAGRACNVCYVPIRQALLRSHTWNFAVARATLSALSPAPTWGRSTEFQLPSDFLKIHPEYEERNSLSRDWVIEGKKIVTNWTDSLELRYIKDVTDVNEMDPLFRELLSTVMAFEMCEQITQSNQKKEGLRADRRDILIEARRANAIDKVSSMPPEDPWITVRR